MPSYESSPQIALGIPHGIRGKNICTYIMLHVDPQGKLPLSPHLASPPPPILLLLSFENKSLIQFYFFMYYNMHNNWIKTNITSRADRRTISDQISTDAMSHVACLSAVATLVIFLYLLPPLAFIIWGHYCPFFRKTSGLIFAQNWKQNLNVW